MKALSSNTVCPVSRSETLIDHVPRKATITRMLTCCVNCTLHLKGNVEES